MLGGGKSLDSTVASLSWAEEFYTVESDKDCVNTENGYEGTHSFTKYTDQRP